MITKLRRELLSNWASNRYAIAASNWILSKLDALAGGLDKRRHAAGVWASEPLTEACRACCAGRWGSHQAAPILHLV